MFNVVINFVVAPTTLPSDESAVAVDRRPFVKVDSID